MSVFIENESPQTEFLPDGVVFEHKFIHSGFKFLHRKWVVYTKRTSRIEERFYIIRTFWSTRFKLPEKFYHMGFKTVDNALNMIRRHCDIKDDMSNRTCTSAERLRGWIFGEDEEKETEINL